MANTSLQLLFFILLLRFGKLFFPRFISLQGPSLTSIQDSMSFKCLPFSRSVIVDVIHAIVSRPIGNNAIRPSTKILHGQPLTNPMFEILSKGGIQRSLYSTHAQALAYEDTTDFGRDVDSMADELNNTSLKKNKRKRDYSKSCKLVTKKDSDGKSITVNKFKLKSKKQKAKNVDEYNGLMSRVMAEGRLNKAINYFREMENNGIKPNVKSYTMIINGYTKQSDMVRAKKWLKRMQQNNIKSDAHVYTSLIDGYMSEANVDEAELMFKTMMKNDIKPTLVTYNILMHHSVRQLNMESALKFWGSLLKAGLKSDVYTYAIILHGLGDAERVDEAWRTFKTMQEENVDVNEVVATTLMAMHVKQHDNEYALQIFNKFFTSQSESKPLLPTEHTRNVLLNAVIAKADVEKISQYYDQYKSSLDKKEGSISPLFVGANVYTYTTFMRAFLRHNNLEMVSQVYTDMTARKIRPTIVTYATLMLAHAFVPDPESCNRILQELKKGGVELNAVPYTIVMRAWAKAGKWEQVKNTYELMKQDNIQPTKITMEVLRYGRSRSTDP